MRSASAGFQFLTLLDSSPQSCGVAVPILKCRRNKRAFTRFVDEYAVVRKSLRLPLIATDTTGGRLAADHIDVSNRSGKIGGRGGNRTRVFNNCRAR